MGSLKTDAVIVPLMVRSVERCRDSGQFGRVRREDENVRFCGPVPGGSRTAFAGPEKTTNASRASEAIKDLFFILFLVLVVIFV